MVSGARVVRVVARDEQGGVARSAGPGTAVCEALTLEQLGDATPGDCVVITPEQPGPLAVLRRSAGPRALLVVDAERPRGGRVLGCEAGVRLGRAAGLGREELLQTFDVVSVRRDRSEPFGLQAERAREAARGRHALVVGRAALAALCASVGMEVPDTWAWPLSAMALGALGARLGVRSVDYCPLQPQRPGVMRAFIGAACRARLPDVTADDIFGALAGDPVAEERVTFAAPDWRRAAAAASGCRLAMQLRRDTPWLVLAGVGAAAGCRWAPAATERVQVWTRPLCGAALVLMGPPWSALLVAQDRTDQLDLPDAASADAAAELMRAAARTSSAWELRTRLLGRAA